jgi:group I intron endonuclease
MLCGDISMHYLYKITNLINNKGYIGQSIDPEYRWKNHQTDARAWIKQNRKNSNKILIVDRAIAKYGVENFSFEVIAYCSTYEDTNNTETLLVEQHGTHVSKWGYNVAFGGINAPRTEEWKQALREWRDSLSPEERAEISRKQSEATIQQIATQGHPAQGTKRTPEQSQNLSRARRENPVEYTPEIRQRMSDAHIGVPLSESHRLNMVASIQAAWDRKNAVRIASGELKCNAPDCDISGIAPYLIVSGVRYCSKHGQRLKRTGHLEIQPIPPEKWKQMYGHTPTNKKFFTEEEISRIMNDTRPIEKIAKDFGVTAKVIVRVRKEQGK